MIVTAVLGPDPLQAIASLSGQLVLQHDPRRGSLLFHHDAARDALYVGLCWPQAASQGPAAATGAGDAQANQRQLKAQEAAALRAALLLFLTAHAVVWVQPPGTPPDARTLATLRLLQQAKQLLQPSLPQLVGAGGSADPSPPWQQPPLLLFACQAPPDPAAVLSAEQLAQAAQQLDAQLRALLRRCRVLLPEEQPAALCALRPQSAVWMLGSLGQSRGSAVRQAFAALRAGAGPGASVLTPGGGQRVTAGAEGEGAGSGADASASNAQLLQLRSALAEHTAGLAGTQPPPSGPGAASVGISLATWQAVVTRLAAALQCTEALGAEAASLAGAERGAEPPEGAAAAAAWLAGCSSLVQQASDARCQRAVAAAREAYLRAVPTAYPPAVHASALQAALRAYAALARGPASLEYEERVRRECEALWQDGRQQCQARSVWGHPCVLPPHGAQVPHSSNILYTLATPTGQQQAAVEDPFPSAPAAQPLAAPVQPGPMSASEAQQAAASRLAMVPLLVRQEALGGAAAIAATAAQGGAPALAGLPAAQQGQQQQQRQLAGVLSGCFVEVHVLAPSKAAQGPLQQPGLLPGSSQLHRFQLQTSHQEEQEEEEFPALGPVQPAPAAEQEAPAVLNWPGTATVQGPAAAGAAAAAARQVVGPPQPGPQPMGGRGRPGKKGGRAGAGPAAPPVLLVGMEYEALSGSRAIITPAQLSACTASSLDLVAVTDAAGGSGSAPLPACPRTDTLADAAAEALGAAAAAAAAAKRAAAASPASAAAPPPGGPAAELMLTTTLPLFLHLSPEQLGGGSGGRSKGGLAAASAGKPGWWQLRRIFVATPPGELRFSSRPQLRLEFPQGLPRDQPLPSSDSMPAAAGEWRSGDHAQPLGTAPAAAAPRPAAQSVAGAAVALVYQPRQPLPLPPDALCCIALPWLFTLLRSSSGEQTGATAVAEGGGLGAEAAVGTPLMLGAGAPLRAVLLGGTALRPELLS